jgi:hypothetical protein
MKNMKFIALVVALAFVALSCKSTPKKTETSTSTSVGAVEKKQVQPVEEVEKKEKPTEISFGEISWIAEQISPSFWPSALKNKSTMFITFHMPVSQDVDINRIEKIFVASPKDMWLLEGSKIKNVVEMDKKDKKLVIKRLQCVNGALPLGDWTVEVTLTDGGFASKTLNVSGMQVQATDKAESKPEASAENAKDKEAEKPATKYLVPNAANSNEVACLAIPVIKSVSRDADSIEIRFSVKDSRVKNGYFWFDVPGEIYYRDSGSMIDASGKPVNGCRKFSTDGAECVYILRKDKTNADWFAKIIGAYFVVADVNRVQSPWEERIRSVSERAVVK